MTLNYKPLVALALLCGLSAPALAEPTLSLDEALAIALGREDPAVRRFQERAAGEREAATAATALPDPMVSLGVRNLPLDDFSLDREPMTQLSLGVRQSFPRGDSRRLKADAGRLKADELGAQADNEALAIAREVKTAWHQVRYSYIAETELRALRKLLDDLKNQQESNFAAGGTAALERIYRTELEIALLDDRLASAVQDRDRAITMLARYVGPDAANRPLPDAAPATVSIPANEQVDDAIRSHPALMVATSREAQAGKSVALAEEAYKPEWGVELMYGARFAERSDFGSAVVTFDLPFWTGKRQDPALRAAKRQAQAAALDHEALRLSMTQVARATLADIRALKGRLDHFDTETIKRATDAEAATGEAYKAGAIDFADLVRAEITLLDTRLRAEMLRRDIAIARAALAYFMGETQ